MCILLTGALFFFLAERKIEESPMYGIIMCVFASLNLITFLRKYCFIRVRDDTRYVLIVNGIPMKTNNMGLYCVLSFVGALFLSTCLLWGISKLLGNMVFNAKNDGKGKGTLAKTFFGISSFIAMLGGIYAVLTTIILSFLSLHAPIKLQVLFGRLARTIGYAGAGKLYPLLYGIILFLLGLVGMVQVIKNQLSIINVTDIPKPITAAELSGSDNTKDKILGTGFIMSVIGIAGTWLIALVGLIIWHKVYFYNGYGYTKVLCTIAMILMLVGFVLLIIGIIRKLVSKKKPGKINDFIFPGIIILLDLFDIMILIINWVNSSP
ncbi:MAG: hypothetical protein K5871_04305 [Lachnospiraceae bacterium]|nr:hypothetical protein [Lachnospiraceae bacterium]